jgi:hypothetical protein
LWMTGDGYKRRFPRGQRQSGFWSKGLSERTGRGGREAAKGREMTITPKQVRAARQLLGGGGGREAAESERGIGGAFPRAGGCAGGLPKGSMQITRERHYEIEDSLTYLGVAHGGESAAQLKTFAREVGDFGFAV